MAEADSALADIDPDDPDGYTTINLFIDIFIGPIFIYIF
jgi:hypothetical protein